MNKKKCTFSMSFITQKYINPSKYFFTEQNMVAKRDLFSSSFLTNIDIRFRRKLNNDIKLFLMYI